MKKLQSRVSIKVKGLNQERAFNNLSKEVEILKLEREDQRTCQLEVLPKDAKKTKKFLRNNNFEILSEKSFGAYKWGKWFLSYYGIIAGLLLCITAYLVQLPFLWQICVFGNEVINSSEITQVINQQLPSRLISQIDTKEIEIVIKENFERVSSVSVAIVGQCLVVNINEKVLPDEMTTNFQPIVSEYDCRITHIELIQGTLNIKEGDIVRKGEVIVEPYIIDSEGQKREVKAMANITADVWLVGTKEHRESYYRTYRTGNKVEESKVLLFGMTIYSNSKEMHFENYQEEVYVEDLITNNILPFKLEKRVFYETKTELVETKFEDCKDEIINDARENALQNMEECEIIKGEDYTVSSAGGVSIVTYIVTVERKIGGYNGSD